MDASPPSGPRSSSDAQVRPAPWVWMYHSVTRGTEDPFNITVSPERFAAQMRLLSRTGRRGVSLRELLGTPPGRARDRLVGLTFDDGYVDFVDEVLPELERHDFTATVYVVAGRLAGHNDWETHGPRKPLMSEEQVREADRRGAEIGSHTLTHAHLPELGASALADEVTRSRRELEDVLGREVRGFCYPYGDVGPREVAAAAEAGYAHATVVGHAANPGPLALPRTFVGQRDGSLRLAAKRARFAARRPGVPW